MVKSVYVLNVFVEVFFLLFGDQIKLCLMMNFGENMFYFLIILSGL